jgi:hypothetical protein
MVWLAKRRGGSTGGAKSVKICLMGKLSLKPLAYFALMRTTKWDQASRLRYL